MKKDKAKIESLVSTVQLICQDIGIEVGIKKHGAEVPKRAKLCKSEGIKLINGLTIKEFDDEGYKYLDILELFKFKEREMKDKIISNRAHEAVQTCNEISSQW